MNKKNSSTRTYQEISTHLLERFNWLKLHAAAPFYLSNAPDNPGAALMPENCRYQHIDLKHPTPLESDDASLDALIVMFCNQPADLLKPWLAEMRRALKPNGTLLLAFSHSDTDVMGLGDLFFQTGFVDPVLDREILDDKEVIFVYGRNKVHQDLATHNTNEVAIPLSSIKLHKPSSSKS